MSEVQRLCTRVVDGDPLESAGGRHDARDWQERTERQNANELAAQTVAGHLLGRRLTQEELRVAAPVSHYLCGAALGDRRGRRLQARGATGRLVVRSFEARVRDDDRTRAHVAVVVEPVRGTGHGAADVPARATRRL